MKLKHVMWIVTAVIAIAAAAAGIALFVTKFLKEEDEDNYIECELEDDED